MCCRHGMVYLMNPRNHSQWKFAMACMSTDKMETQLVYHKSLKLMGNLFQLSAIGDNEDWANECIDAGIDEIRRIEKLLTTYNEESETALINRNAGIKPVAVCEET